MFGNKEYCDFYVWTEQDFHYERIYPDIEFWSNCLKKCKDFFRLCLLPELVGKFYSRMTLCDEINEDKVNQLSPDTFCYCNGPDEGGIIACDNMSA